MSKSNIDEMMEFVRKGDFKSPYKHLIHFVDIDEFLIEYDHKRELIDRMRDRNPDLVERLEDEVEEELYDEKY